MTMNDPIVDEVRQVRDAHAAQFNYDLDAIYQDIKELEKKRGTSATNRRGRRHRGQASISQVGKGGVWGQRHVVGRCIEPIATRFNTKA